MNTLPYIPIQHIGIITKYDAPLAEKTAKEIALWLQEQGISVWQETANNITPQSFSHSPKLDLLIVLGGDGTIISVSRRAIDAEIPIVGVNFGLVGFLAALTKDTWKQGLEKLLKYGLQYERRISLTYELERDEKIIHAGEVINDVVITRGKYARLTRLDLTLNNEYLMPLRSDGIVISTPTGSSGYASSAGGSLLSSSLNAYIVAAICPFINTFSPLVLEADSILQVSLSEQELDLYLALDGQETIPLKSNDILRVTGKKERVLFADIGLQGYVERLRRAGFISHSTTPS